MELEVNGVGGRLDQLLSREPSFVSGLRQSWLGTDAEGFLGQWQGVDRPALQSVSDRLTEIHEVLRRNRLAQEETSATSEGSSGATSPFPLQGGGGIVIQGPGAIPGDGRLVVDDSGVPDADLRVSTPPSRPDAAFVADLGQVPIVGLESTSFAIDSSTTALGIVGGDGASEVTMTRMSDGSYTVTINSTTNLSAGVSLRDLIGIDGPGDLDLGVDTENGWMLEFSARDEESAQALTEHLQGRTSSATNRFFGQVDQSEVTMGTILDGPAYEFSSFTKIHAGAGVDAGAGIGPSGFDVDGYRHNETTFNADGSIT
ncbi:MAG: hypothetical protein AAFO29_25405, partial [Actinomycetota bacterium]